MEFNLKRFFELLKREVILNKKSYLLALVAFAISATFVIASFDNQSMLLSNDSSYRGIINNQYILWYAIVLSSFMYEAMKQKSSLMNEILVPCSSFEKYLVSFFRVYLLIPIASFIGIIGFFLILKYPLGTTLHYPTIEALSLGIVFKFLFYNLLYTLPIIAILHYFTNFKNRFIPILVLFAILIFTNLWGYIDRIIGIAINGTRVDNFMPYFGTEGFYSWAIIISAIIFLLFQYLSFIRVNEREI
ncbi:MAG: hypothetical protein H6Q16_99 [Bacteroidetes bacterium]|nr:hypothetical protein [Bacteroidota bacterium]